jgi:N-acetylglucosamine-6-phosphate deacetylase
MLIKRAMLPGKYGDEIKDILIDDNGVINKIGDNLRENSAYEFEARDYYVIPGFIDIHTHGFNNHGTEEPCDGLLEIAKGYASRGTLGFCPTITPKPFHEYLRIIDEYKKAFDGNYEGARFLGLHLEGPYLNPRKAGAISPESMYSINLKELEEFLKASKGYVKIMTLAPELEGSEEAIKLLTKYGVTASAGHTYATHEEAVKGIDTGITHATHTFNAMRDFSHRAAGVLEAVLLNDNVYCELIADGIHVSRQAMEMLLKLKGNKKVIAISDGGKSCGIEYADGYVFEDGHFIKNGAIYTPNGILCGSTKDVYEHFKFFVSKMGYSIYESINFTSGNAAVSLGLNVGKIKEGREANLLLIDKELNIKSIIINGRIYKQ